MKRILFVDDEPQVLDGLRALLRPTRHEWEAVFVPGGEEALLELDRAPFDVVVSDMKMPHMDGAALLRQVQVRHPGVVRIVLSGHAELEAGLRTVPVAHQFLLKPCERGVLERVIRRTCDLQSLVNNEDVRSFVGSVERLPSLPQLYVQLTKALESDESSVSEIARIVEQDPAMCAKVLQLVNSAFIGAGRDLSDVEQAIRYLGMNLLKNLVLASQVFQPRRSDEDRSGDIARLQRHGLLVGALARRIVGPEQQHADDAFIAGMLHDIGKLVLLEQQPELARLVRVKARLARQPVHEAEFATLGLTHAEIGGFLLGIWGLPYPIVEAATNHHAPERVHAPVLDVFCAVHVANGLIGEYEATPGAETRAPLNEVFLEAAGVRGRLEEWRADAEGLIAGAAT